VSLRRDALTGGAALAAGLVLGFIVDRLARSESSSAGAAPTDATSIGIRRTIPRPPRQEVPESTDVLERYRAAAAV
jgi:hypothetical protein